MITRDLRTLITATLLLVATVSCSGGSSSGGGGIGGSGIITQGTITGFGSIFVNGVRFDTTSLNSVVIDESGASESDLALGMIVTITGSRDDANMTGSADSIVVDHTIRGPVASVGAPDSDNATRTLQILGQTVRVRRHETVFEGTSFDTLETDAVNTLVRVSAFGNGAGELAATRVEITGGVTPGVTEIEFSGEISNLVAGTSFEIGSIRINIDADTEIEGPSLADGQLVEVEGVIEAGLVSVLAREIEPESSGLPDDAEDVEIEGIVESVIDQRNFSVAGILIDASGASFEPSSLVIEAGVRVEIEGDLINGVLVAEEVEGRGGSVSIEAFVDSVSSLTNSLELAILPDTEPNNTLTVLINENTRFTDERDETSNFNLSSIVAGDYVLVESNQSSPVLATQLTRVDDEDRVIVTATLESHAHMPPFGSVGLLGLIFLTHDSMTSFESDADDDDDDDDDDELSGSGFFNQPAVAANAARIKAVDNILTPNRTGDGQAEEVEIVD